MADPALALGAQDAFALVPVQFVVTHDLLGQRPLEQCWIQFGGQVDALLALPLATAQVGHHQPGRLHQPIRLAKAGGPAIGQPIVLAAGLALLGDAIRIGAGQQGPGPARVFGIGHRPLGLATQQAAVLTDQLTNARHPAARAAPFAGQEQQTGMQVGALPRRQVALAQQCGDLAGALGQAPGLATQQQVRQPRMGRQTAHGLAVRGEHALVVQGTQAHQQVAGLGQGRGRRGIEPGQLLGAHAPAGQLQRQPGEVGLEDLGAVVGRQLLVQLFRPKPVTDARLQSAGAALALGGRGAGDAAGGQAGHAAAGIEGRHPCQTCIHHHPYPFDGQAGLGDIGGQHHLAAAHWRRLDGCPLGRQFQFTMQRAEQHRSRQVIRQPLGGAADLRLPGQEHQQAAGFLVQCLQHRGGHPRFQAFVRAERSTPAGRDRKHPSFATHHGRITKQRGQTLAFQGGGHHQHLERRIAQQLAPAQGQRQGQIGVQTAFMEFVEDHQADAVQRRIVLQPAGEDALGDHLDTGARPYPAFQADAIAHRLADAFAQFRGQALGGSASRQPARLQQQDALTGQPGFVQQRQGHPGGLAGAGRRFQHAVITEGEGLAQVGQDNIDGQGRHWARPVVSTGRAV